ncbi:MAG: hypothetical protein R6U32_01130 [Candidatus Woesearchaeota archaeon]
MKTKKAALILIVALLAGILLAVLAYRGHCIDKVQHYNMSIIVGDHLGFDTDNRTLAFGMVMPGRGSCTRFISLKNKAARTMNVEFEGRGRIGDWISIDGTEIMLGPYENRTVRVSATPPGDAEYGNYTGVLEMTFRKPCFS